MELLYFVIFSETESGTEEKTRRDGSGNLPV